MKKTILSIFALATIITNVNAQNVNIPDANLKSRLVTEPSINTNGDTEIQTSEAIAYIGTLFLGSANISDATGIEAFTNAVGIQIQGNMGLTELDLSANTSMQNISCNSTGLTSLFIGNNTALEDLYANNTSLTSLDVSGATNLEKLILSDVTTLTGIDLTSNTQLDELNCAGSSLIGGSGAIKTIDVSQNTLLTTIKIQNCGLTSVDVSSNTNLNNLNCSNNDLEYLNVATGDNANMGNFSNIALDARNNANLTCIQIDNGFTPSTPNWEKDATANYSTLCVAPCYVNIPDANFKAYLVGNAAINTNGDTEIQCSEASSFSGTINCASLSISDVTGIEAFTALTNLTCNNNSLNSLDVSNNTALTYLNCGSNLLSFLNVSSNTSLYTLNAHSNSISSLNVGSNLSLANLHIGNNPTSIVDVSNNLNLITINCAGTQVTTLDVSNNTLLEYINAEENSLITSLNAANGANTNLTGFQAYDCPNLNCIQIDDVTYSNTNWTNWPFDFDAASSFSTNCSAVLVSSIDVQGLAGASSITVDDGTLQMEATVLPANADDATYTWSVTNGTGSASINAGGILTAISNGTVDVIATANDGSGTTGMTTITISNQTVGIIENQLVQFNIYPNPVQNELFIELKENQINQINIIDLSGKTLLTQKQINGNSIDVSSLAQGVYTIQISTEKGIATSRFVKK